jgi:hypothetical protein
MECPLAQIFPRNPKAPKRPSPAGVERTVQLLDVLSSSSTHEDQVNLPLPIYTSRCHVTVLFLALVESNSRTPPVSSVAFLTSYPTRSSNMAPPLPSSARLRLKYPLYGCDFDPLSSSYLVVGGGGGEGNSGLPKTAIVSEATRCCRSEY